MIIGFERVSSFFFFWNNKFIIHYVINGYMIWQFQVEQNKMISLVKINNGVLVKWDILSLIRKNNYKLS
jgi:hypothetical protein